MPTDAAWRMTAAILLGTACLQGASAPAFADRLLDRTQHADWTYEKQVDEFTDEIWHRAFAPNTRGGARGFTNVFAQCGLDKRFAIFVRTSGFTIFGEYSSGRYRIDKNEARSIVWSSGNQNIVLWDAEEHALTRGMLRGSTLLIEARDYGRTRHRAEFSLRGSMAAMGKVLRACGIDPDAVMKGEEEPLPREVDDAAPQLAAPSSPQAAARPCAAALPASTARDTEAVRIYGNELHQRLNGAAARSYPRQSIRLEEEGVVPARLRIAAGGELLSVRVLDDTLAASRLVHAARRAIQRSAPFPCFAPGMGTSPVEFDVRINYRLE